MGHVPGLPRGSEIIFVNNIASFINKVEGNIPLAQAHQPYSKTGDGKKQSIGIA